MATFIIGGLWHGSGWTFVFWGFLHGIALVIHRAWSKLGFKLWTWIAWLITFNFVNIAWVFFRAKEWEDAVKVLRGMFSIEELEIHPTILNKIPFLHEYAIPGQMFGNIGGNRELVVWIFIGFLLVLLFKNSNQKLYFFKNSHITSIFSAFLFGYAALSFSKASEFLYFNF